MFRKCINFFLVWLKSREVDLLPVKTTTTSCRTTQKSGVRGPPLFWTIPPPPPPPTQHNPFTQKSWVSPCSGPCSPKPLSPTLLPSHSDTERSPNTKILGQPLFWTLLPKTPFTNPAPLSL